MRLRLRLRLQLRDKTRRSCWTFQHHGWPCL
jgi:hypothetical protein